MELFGWFEESRHSRVALKYARITGGAQCVIINGTGQTLWLYVGSWDYLQQVTAKIYCCSVVLVSTVDILL